MANTVAAAIFGIASVIDGDTLDIHGTRVRLFGVDAPESAQVCVRAGKPWRCGQSAALALADHLAGATVRCERVGKSKSFERVVARCYVGTESLQDWLVVNGWALDEPRYSKGAWLPLQRQAQASKRGVWSSEFQSPWEWRRARRR